jgi:hypothetical protein
MTVENIQMNEIKTCRFECSHFVAQPPMVAVE